MPVFGMTGPLPLFGAMPGIVEELTRRALYVSFDQTGPSPVLV
jgi:hypothetical protein